MGNDIKLPSNQRRELTAIQKASEAESRNQIAQEIGKIADTILSVNNQIRRIEHNLKQMSKNIQYYNELITELSNTLLRVKSEQINAQLTYENYVERAKWYLDSANIQEAETNIQTDDDDYSEATIANLQNSIAALINAIDENEKCITKYV